MVRQEGQDYDRSRDKQAASKQWEISTNPKLIGGFLHTLSANGAPTPPAADSPQYGAIGETSASEYPELTLLLFVALCLSFGLLLLLLNITVVVSRSCRYASVGWKALSTVMPILSPAVKCH